jgi:hypothetical protein
MAVMSDKQKGRGAVTHTDEGRWLGGSYDSGGSRRDVGRSRHCCRSAWPCIGYTDLFCSNHNDYT